MSNFSMESISPETLAAKFAAAKDFTNLEFAAALKSDRQLAELLWFLEWQSRQPGALPAFINLTVEGFAASFGPAWLHDADAKPILDQRLEAWKLLPDDCKRSLIPKNLWTDREDELTPRFQRIYPLPKDDAERKQFHAALSSLSVERLAEAFTDQAKQEMPGIIRVMCNETLLWKTPRRWFCKDIIGVLVESMELHAARALQQIALTELVDVVFDTLDYAWSERRVVKIDGHSRTGKTEAINAWANAYPGRCRLVTVPPGISTRDLFSAVAESLGIPFNPQTSIYKLRDSVQFVIRHCGLMIILDEAHFILPPPSSQAATPARLDWLRSNVMDRRMSCALVCTPQNWKHAQTRLEKTGYNMDQLFGRIDLSVPLPEEPRPDDLEAVVELHGWGIPKELHQLIVLKVTANEAYLKSVEAACCRSRYIAKKAGRPVCQADVETAIAEVIPSSAAKPKPATRQQEAAPIVSNSRSRHSATALQSPQRETAPPSLTVNH